MVNLALYALTVSIWGSTWLVITFQLGTPIAVAIGWRFTLASLILSAGAWRGGPASISIRARSAWPRSRG